MDSSSTKDRVENRESSMAVVEAPTGVPNARVITHRLLDLTNDVRTLTHKHIEEDPVIKDVPRATILTILQELINKKQLVAMYEMGPASSATVTSGSNSVGIPHKITSSTSYLIASDASHFQGLPTTPTEATAGYQSLAIKRESLPVNPSKKLVIKRLKMDAVGGEVVENIATVFDAKLQPTMSSGYIPKLREYWEAVLVNRKDLGVWEVLLIAVYRSPDIPIAREVYQTFLQRFPLYHGYWKKWASYEMKYVTDGDYIKILQVFNMGLKAMPYSIELWVHYLTYCSENPMLEETFVREQYEKAIALCGVDFYADYIWDLFIEWEMENGNYKGAFQLYDRLLDIPIHHQVAELHRDPNKPAFYETHWKKFVKLIDDTNLEDLFSAQEYKALVENKRMGLRGGAPVILLNHEIKSIKRTLKDDRLPRLTVTEDAVMKRWKYERLIYPHYFLPSPLEPEQLDNWKSLLKLEMEQGDWHRIDVMFERFLIAGAGHAEVWQLYVDHLNTRMKELSLRAATEVQLREVYTRACTTHVPEATSLYLQWAELEERTGNISKAHLILDRLDPKLESVATRRVSLFRHEKKNEKVIKTYKKFLDLTPNPVQMALRASRFAAKVVGDELLAVKFVKDSMKKAPENEQLYTQLFDIFHSQLPVNFAGCVKSLDEALESRMALKVRISFGEKKLLLMKLYGSSKEQIEAEDQLCSLKMKLSTDN